VAETISAGSKHSRPIPFPSRDPEWLGAPLPTLLTSFVGRERDVATVTDLLRRPEVRLVTLTGPGGVGKTRLAVRAAGDVTDDFPDGVAFISLAAIADPALVPPTVARALESTESGDRSPLQRLTSVLRSARALLVLDNFEQVIEAAPFVAELLAGCPYLTMLVTSRSSLHISGEHEFPVDPLPVPDPNRLPPLAELAGYGAVDLFTQRARAVRPDFAIQETNAAAVAEICARLDGLPLAIELAAARSKVLSPQAVLARLEHRLSLLTGGSRDYPERLRAMREAIAWSYDLLAPHEQALFRRLAVFAGGCTLEAAEVVAGTGLPSPQATLDSLTSLVDSSLLIQRQQADGEPRFSMLETIREYGLELLAVTGEAEETRRRFADWCLETAEEFDRINRRWMDPAVAISRLAPEHDNMRATLAWQDSLGDEAAIVRLAGALFGFWYVHGDLREGLSWLERTREDADEIPPAVRARALLGAGMLAHYASDDARAIPWLDASLALHRAVDDHWGIGFTHLMLGIAAEDAGDYETAASHFAESLVSARAIDNPVMTGLVLLHQGIIAWGEGDRARAERLVTEALAVQRLADDLLYGAAESIGLLGLLACEAGDLPRSVELQRESLAHILEKGYLEVVAANLANVAMLALAAKRPAVAARLFGAAFGQREAIGNPFKLPERAVYERAIESTKAFLPADLFTAAWSSGRAHSLAEAVAEAFAALDEIGGQTATGASPASAGVQEAVAGLTARELEVLRLLAAGGSNREIADALFVSPRTVQVHLANIFSKLDVHSRAAAVARAYELGLN
jgi:predicted ATPase/DNA-binding CsgD family transcriptional regulator